MSIFSRFRGKPSVKTSTTESTGASLPVLSMQDQILSKQLELEDLEKQIGKVQSEIVSIRRHEHQRGFTRLRERASRIVGVNGGVQDAIATLRKTEARHKLERQAFFERDQFLQSRSKELAVKKEKLLSEIRELRGY